MTVENCIKWLRTYEKRIENPAGNKENMASEEREKIRKQAKLAYENMKKHILSSKKFVGHSILAELQETKKDGKKSKR